MFDNGVTVSIIIYVKCNHGSCLLAIIYSN